LVTIADRLSHVGNPGYFPPILGLFWAVLDYLRLIPGYLPPIYRHIVIHCQCPPSPWWLYCRNGGLPQLRAAPVKGCPS
jgi:hypothetical protein